MKDKYNPKEIEAKWRQIWIKQKTFNAKEEDPQKKFYMLEMFPYPSGRIHMGHVRNYAIGDVIARYYRKKGFKIIHPMGWDAFGLPAENAAIERNIHPAKWTFGNIDEMRAQIQTLGFSYDWDREIATCHPGYYKWEQLIFNRALEKGLVYRKKAVVNWSEKMQTVLANEQVIDGLDYRYGLPVVQKELTQWFFKITDYADALLEGLLELEGSWPQRVIREQRARIGKSHGAKVYFKFDEPVGGEENMEIFTTRPDTLWGVTFMSLAPEHPFARKLIKGTSKEIEAENFINKVCAEDKKKRGSDDYEKEGFFTGRYCTNPVNGDRIPIYISNFVLMDYGTGAIMAVPAHDQRDFEFATKYNIPIKVVINPMDGTRLDSKTMTEAYVDAGIMTGSDIFDGKNNFKSIPDITRHLSEKSWGEKTVNYRLRDWCISRQRYWGTPVPVIYCDDCGAVPVPDEDLPVLLPDDVKFEADGGSPLARCENFVNTMCPKCDKPAKRETDTFDTFVESSWYHLRYTSPRDTDAPFSKEKVAHWLPVDQYIGGIEHAVGHLIYSRFYHRLLKDMGFIPGDVSSEPFSKLLTQGMVCMETKYTLDEKNQPEWHYPEEVENDVSKLNGKKILTGRVEKMSKSRRNVIDPNTTIEKYGVDSARMFTLFAAPPENDLAWNNDGVEGINRFLSRLWRLIFARLEDIKNAVPYTGDSSSLDKDSLDLRRITHQTIARVTDDIENRYRFNTAIARCMELNNFLSKYKVKKDNPDSYSVQRDAFFALTSLITPFAPHFAEEINEILGGETLAALLPWPTWDEDVAKDSTVTIAVQIMGKLRGTVEIKADATKQEMEKAALDDEKIKNRLAGQEIARVIVVPGKLVNIVIKKMK